MENVNIVCCDYKFTCTMKNTDNSINLNVSSDEMFHENRVFFLCYDFWNFEKCSLQDVYDNPNKNYYFIFGTWFLNSYWVLSDLKMIPLPKNLLEALKNCDNFYVMFINGAESECADLIDAIKYTCDKDGYKEEKFFIVNNNYILEDRKKEVGSNVNVHSSRSLAYAHTKSFLKCHVPFIREKEFLFLSHTRIPKPHRYGILIYFLKNKMIHELDWSLTKGYEYQRNKFMVNNNINYTYYFDIFNREDIRDYEEEIKYIGSIDVKKSKYEQNVNWFDLKPNGDPVNYDWGNQFVVNTFVNSYINITTESSFNRPYTIHITEKSFKPFYFLQIPIIVATKGHIGAMKERYEFDFFDDLIDHSYDNESDHKKRFQMILNQIKNLYENKNRVIEFYSNNEKRFMENQKKMLKIMKDDTDLNFIKKLPTWKKN